MIGNFRAERVASDAVMRNLPSIFDHPMLRLSAVPLECSKECAEKCLGVRS